MHTLESHAVAKAALEAAERRWENYDGNNPNKHRAAVQSCRAELGAIEAELKARGILPRTEKEERDARITAAFPSADSREVVEFEGKRYRKRFTPRATSLSGKTAYGYDAYWEEVVS